MKTEQHELAESIFNTYVEKLKQQKRSRLNSVLNAMGYNKWITPFGSYRSDNSFSDRRYVIKACNEHHDSVKIKQLLREIWTGARNRADEEDIPGKVEWVKPFAKFEGSFIHWGLEATLGREILFQTKHQEISVSILDGDKELYAKKIFPIENDEWGETITTDVLKGDDDVRIIVAYGRYSGVWRRMLGGTYPFDFAKVGGLWQRLKYQGRDWDGEFEDYGMTPDEDGLDTVIEKVREYANEIQHGMTHVRKWKKALDYLEGREDGYTPDEIRRQWEDHRRNRRWTEVVEMIPFVEKRNG